MNSARHITGCRLVAGLLLLALIATADVAAAQEKYPARAINVIVPWGPGGGSDYTARMIAQFLKTELNVPLPVVNAPGASGVIGVGKLLANPADGYSIGVTGEPYALIGTPDAKWKLTDFAPLAVVVNQPSAVFVSKGSRFKTWADVEKEARAKPDTITIAFDGPATISEIHINYLAAKGIKLIAVPFAKPGERYVSVLGGHADLLYEQAGDIKSFLENNQMQPILSFTRARYPAYPKVPTGKELGYDISVPLYRWVYMKAGTDPQRVKVVGDALARMAKTPEYQAYLKSELAAPDSFVPAKDAGRYMQQELDALRKEAAVAGMKVKE